MANKQAAWLDETIIEAVDTWWHKQFPLNEANYINANRTVTVEDLYHSYYDWATQWERRAYRVNLDQFAKCLMAARIMDIGGIWRQAAEWNPTADQIRRVTA